MKTTQLREPKAFYSNTHEEKKLNKGDSEKKEWVQIE